MFMVHLYYEILLRSERNRIQYIVTPIPLKDTAQELEVGLSRTHSMIPFL